MAEATPQQRARRAAARFGFGRDGVALKDAAIVVVPLVLLVAASFWIASRYVKPAPPDAFVMTTGVADGAYHLFGQRYRDILARDGVRVELRTSAGSIENLKRLADPSSNVEAGFVQGGVASAQDTQGLLSLGSIYYEPLWIFYRGAHEFELLNELRGKRIAIGPEGSGTRALALQLLRAVGADSAGTTLAALGGSAAAQALIDAELDAVFFVASPDASFVQRLAKADGVRLLSLGNAEAFTRRFPFLSVLKLPRGVIDLAAQLPARDVTLLAPAANLIVRADFHPALAFLLLNAAAELHAASGLLQRRGEFPAGRETEFRLSDEAQRYFKAGPPLLQRYLPFWLANLAERTLVLLVPLFAVVVPAIKVLPALMHWRVKSRVFRWYGEIRFLEDELGDDPSPESVPEILARLAEIERGVDRTPVPRHYADYAYNLRMHIDLVRNRVLRLAQTHAADGTGAARSDGK